MRRTVMTIFALLIFMLIPTDALAQTTQGPTKIKGTATNGLSLEVTGPAQLDNSLTVTGTITPTIPIATTNGGTGATTAAVALANLGGLPLTGGTLTGPLVGTSASFSGTVKSGSTLPDGFSNPTAWGDSLSYGAEGFTNINFPNQLSALIGQMVNNQGVGGQTSSQIAVRMGAYNGGAYQALTAGITIPTSGTVNLSFPTGFAPVTAQTPSSGVQITIQSSPAVTGYVAYAGGSYTFTPSIYPGSPVVVASGTGWIPVIGNLLNGTQIIWAGRNNFGVCTTQPVTVGNCQVAADIAASVAVAVANGDNYVVLTVLNSQVEPNPSTGYTQIMAINAWIKATYPANYVDVQSQLVAAYNPANAADVIDYNNGVPPASLRAQDYAGTLTAAITTTSQTTISLSTYVSTNYILEIGSELMYVTVAGTTVTVTRGYAGTTAATAANGASVIGIDYLHLGDNWMSAANPNCTNGYICVAQEIAASTALYTGPEPLLTVSEVQSMMGQSTANPALPLQVPNNATWLQELPAYNNIYAFTQADGSIGFNKINLNSIPAYTKSLGESSSYGWSYGYIGSVYLGNGSSHPYISGNTDGSIFLSANLYSGTHSILGESGGTFGGIGLIGTSVGSISITNYEGGTLSDVGDGNYAVSRGIISNVSGVATLGEYGYEFGRLYVKGNVTEGISITNASGGVLSDGGDGAFTFSKLIRPSTTSSTATLGTAAYPWGGTYSTTLSLSAAQTTVSCSTSGSVIFSEPLTGTSDKRVLIHLAACVGTASYTYPVSFTNVPSVFASNLVAATVATSVSASAVTVTGATTTGLLILEDY